MASKPAYRGKVTLGANIVLGMGIWSVSGFSSELIDDTEFSDEYEDSIYGLVHGGKITFSGKYKKDNTRGQDILRSYMLNEINLTDMRLYVDSSNYWRPNHTTGAGGGLLAGVPVGFVSVESIDVTLDHLALGDISFTLLIDNAPLRLGLSEGVIFQDDGSQTTWADNGTDIEWVQ